MSTPLPPFAPAEPITTSFNPVWEQPALKKRGRGPAIVGGLLATALVAGAAGGAVGFVAAKQTLPTSVVATASFDSGSPSLPAGSSIADVAAAEWYAGWRQAAVPRDELSFAPSGREGCEVWAAGRCFSGTVACLYRRVRRRLQERKRGERKS